MPLTQTECPVCESHRRRALPFACRWDNRIWSHVQCLQCGHRYTDPVPDDSELAKMYDDLYFSGSGAWISGYWPGSYVENEENLRQEARDTLASLEVRGGRLLEIGTAGGFFLDEARRAGFQVLGVELNAGMAAWGRTNLGLNIICGPFETVQLPPSSFDVVVAMDVLEHIRDPRGMVRRVADLLGPGGKFLVRGPLEDSTRIRIFQWLRRTGRRGTRVDNEPPFHLQGFVRRSFCRLLQHRFEMEMFHVASGGPRWSLKDSRAFFAGLLESAAFCVDQVRGGGDFMIARAVKVS